MLILHHKKTSDITFNRARNFRRPMTSHLLYQEEAYSGHVLQYDPSFLLTGGVASFFLSIFLFKVSMPISNCLR